MSPPTEQEWKTIADGFTMKWNFPNCIGAMDGKHIVIQAPYNSGSQYFNYKGSHSIVLLGVVNADYQFIMIDVGSYGRNCDSFTLTHSPFGKALQRGMLDIPTDSCLPYTSIAQSHVFVADAAFPLTENIM